ncbi:hypothetical protein WICMUC_005846 [Wickerhamomyces mucosus]|uniref:DUF3835 domain-containing protein n=1 Tax=Wickerhamomyces mucosus TaxID=1378264 RepID=A0A9P8P2F5_9ASCO|nr:hypothetical protein WICMUC_005846 [Wickerhamomyces mucosus]
MDQIKDKIQNTVKNLIEKKNLLQNHLVQYQNLKIKLKSFDQYSDNDTPELQFQINDIAKINSRVINPRKILVFLGCDYYVERDPIQAEEIANNKINYLSQTIKEFEIKIKEAKETLKNIDQLIGNHEIDNSNLKKKIEENSQDSGELLPFMDIREELDEDGNVINSTVNPQGNDSVKELGLNRENVNNRDDEIDELLNDMGIIIPNDEPKIQEVVEQEESQIKIKQIDDFNLEEQRLPNIPNVRRNDALEDFIVEHDSSEDEGLNDDIIENRTQPLVETIIERDIQENELELNKDNNDSEIQPIDNEFFKLFKQMNIVDPNSSLSKEISQLEIENNKNDSKQEKELIEKKFDSSRPAIDQDDILQLQLISDEIDEEEFFQDGEDYNDEEIYDRDYYYQDDDEEDYDDEEDNGWNNLIPKDHRDLFMKELENLRAENQLEVDQQNEEKDQEIDDKSIIPIDEINSNDLQSSKPLKSSLKGQNFKSKSVSFAKELQIKEIENISQDLQNMNNLMTKISKFKQARLNNESIPNVNQQLEYKVDNDSNKDFVTGDIVDKDLDNFVDKDNLEDDKQKINTAKVSKFKQSNSNSSNNSTKSQNFIENDSKPLKISKFKQNQLKTNKIQRSSTIISQPISLPIPNSNEESIISNQENYIIKPPQTSLKDDDLFDEEEFLKIKEYIQNDEDDEQLLNSITDIEVYTGDSNINEDEDEDEEEEFDEGPILLDEIIENEEIEDPEYSIDDNIMEREYSELRKKMVFKYFNPQIIKSNKINDDIKDKELEPIDENGNPIKISRFKKSLK